jgi:hypothetical protein
MQPKFGWVMIGGLTGVAAALTGWQALRLAAVQVELAGAREQQREVRLVRAQHDRLQRTQVSEADLAALRSDHAALDRMKAELAGLKNRADAKGARDAAAKAPPVRFGTDSIVPAALWRNAGNATPPGALETTLWAAAGGEINTFAALLNFEPAARASAVQLWTRLPADLQAQYSTPERMMAFFSVKDVPLGTASVRGWLPGTNNDSTVAVLSLAEPEGGKARNVALRFDRQPDGWKLRVTPAAVAKYAAQFPVAPAKE